ncbi:hypothetical protein TNCV_3552181 [Trichonephila clavipes]|nr:hypothetical protein TNCV_3552181 [Trichonephila clavipes]
MKVESSVPPDRVNLRHGPTGPGPRASATMGVSFRSRLSFNKIIIRIISTVKCYFQLNSPKNWKFWTKCQLSTCDDSRSCIKSNPTTIHHHYSFKKRQSVKPVIGGAYICVGTQGLLLLKGPEPQQDVSSFRYTNENNYTHFTVYLNDVEASKFTSKERFVEWAQNEIAVVPDFHKRILFSDEAHFWLNGYVNKQNCRIWSEANPQVYVETPLHPEKLTVWCALWAGGILLQKR